MPNGAHGSYHDLTLVTPPALMNRSLVPPVPPYWRRVAVVLALALTGTGCDVVEAPPLPPPPTLAITLTGTEVRETTVNDGLVQAGEYVLVDFFLTNASDSAYVNVGLGATSAGPVRGLQALTTGSYRGFGRVGPGESVRAYLEFQVSPNTPVGTAVPLTLTLRVPSGVAASFSATLTTAPLPYAWEVGDVAVTADTDGDGRVEPGEEATVRFVTRMTGNSTPVSACGEYRVTTTLAQVVLLGGTDGSCGNGVARSFQFRASSTLAAGTPLPFVVRMSDRLENTWSTPFTIPLGP